MTALSPACVDHNRRPVLLHIISSKDIDGRQRPADAATDPVVCLAATSSDTGGVIILMALRIAATFVRERQFCETALRPRALTAAEGFEPDQLSRAATSIGRLLLPQGWVAQKRAPRVDAEKILQLIRPLNSSSGTLHDQAFASTEREILSAMALPKPVMVLPSDARICVGSPTRVLPPTMTLAPIDRKIMLALLAQTHSVTGKIDLAHVVELLSDDDTLAAMDVRAFLPRCALRPRRRPLH